MADCRTSARNTAPRSMRHLIVSSTRASSATTPRCATATSATFRLLHALSSLSAMTDRDYDVVVIGSGFGGSVAALRASEKGYRVGVMEAGRRFTNDTLPETSWDLKDFLWAPALGWMGIQKITPLTDVVCLSGAGVGGGSLVYANTLYSPLDDFYNDPQWAHIADW